MEDGIDGRIYDGSSDWNNDGMRDGRAEGSFDGTADGAFDRSLEGTEISSTLGCLRSSGDHFVLFGSRIAISIIGIHDATIPGRQTGSRGHKHGRTGLRLRQIELRLRQIVFNF